LQRWVTTELPHPLCSEGAMNGETFKAYIEQFLSYAGKWVTE
jgi:hypothetical protein